MPSVELIYDSDCPNVAAARECLVRAFVAANVTPRWTEHLSNDAPPHARGLGSPTILVDGVDVAGFDETSPESCCRVYARAAGPLAGVPDVDIVARALAPASRPGPSPTSPSPRWGSSLGALPAVASALLPKIACPACWPAYAGFLGSVGLTFLMDVRWLLPLTAVFLVVSIGVLGSGAKRRRGYGPLGLGIIAATGVLVGKFALDDDVLMYLGVALLIGASFWNAWPVRQRAGCDACEVPEHD